jgi:hypothetical protein
MQDNEDKDTSMDEVQTEYKRKQIDVLLWLCSKEKGRTQDNEDKEASMDKVRKEEKRSRYND